MSDIRWKMRAQGTSLFSLIRNIGSSIGISLLQTLLIRPPQSGVISDVEAGTVMD
jgi:hypothetical protein